MLESAPGDPHGLDGDGDGVAVDSASAFYRKPRPPTGDDLTNTTSETNLSIRVHHTDVPIPAGLVLSVNQPIKSSASSSWPSGQYQRVRQNLCNLSSDLSW